MLCRDLSLDDCELKFSGQQGSFEGYASVFGGIDSYGDTIVRGAYSKTITDRKSPVLMLYGHNPGRVIGKWTELSEDDRGLHVRGELTPGHSDAENVYASLKHGAISGLSIGFTIPEGGAEKKEDGRILKNINLIEVSVVSMPADDDARISGVKAAIEELETVRDVERFLRDVGTLSKASACALTSRMKSITQGDPAEMAELKREIADLRERLVKAQTELLQSRYRLPL